MAFENLGKENYFARITDKVDVCVNTITGFSTQVRTSQIPSTCIFIKLFLDTLSEHAE